MLGVEEGCNESLHWRSTLFETPCIISNGVGVLIADGCISRVWELYIMELIEENIRARA